MIAVTDPTKMKLLMSSQAKSDKGAIIKIQNREEKKVHLLQL